MYCSKIRSGLRMEIVRQDGIKIALASRDDEIRKLESNSYNYLWCARNKLDNNVNICIYFEFEYFVYFALLIFII